MGTGNLNIMQINGSEYFIRFAAKRISHPFGYYFGPPSSSSTDGRLLLSLSLDSNKLYSHLVESKNKKRDAQEAKIQFISAKSCPRTIFISFLVPCLDTIRCVCVICKVIDPLGSQYQWFFAGPPGVPQSGQGNSH